MLWILESEFDGDYCVAEVVYRYPYNDSQCRVDIIQVLRQKGFAYTKGPVIARPEELVNIIPPQALVEAIKEETLQQACRAMCEHCHVSQSYYLAEKDAFYHDAYGDFRVRQYCLASPIRREMEQI